MSLHSRLLSLLIASLILTPSGLLLASHRSFSAITQAAEIQNRKAEADDLFEQGIQQFEASQFQAALKSWQSALQIYQDIKNRSREGLTLTKIGTVHANFARYAQAMEYHQQALKIAKEIGDRAIEGEVLSNVGGIYMAYGQTSQALEVLQQALSIQRTLKDTKGESITLITLGSAYQTMGNTEQALKFAKQALTLSQETKNQVGEAWALINLAAAHQAMGKPQEALKFIQQALTLSQQTGNHAATALALLNQGVVYQLTGQAKQAQVSMEQAMMLSQKIGNRPIELNALMNLGMMHLNAGQNKQAQQLLERALKTSQEIDNRLMEANISIPLGASYTNTGEYQRALEIYQQALKTSREFGNLQTEASLLNNIGTVYLVLGKSQEALATYEQALKIAQNLKNQFFETMMLISIGTIELQSSRYTQALQSFEQVLALSKKQSNRFAEVNALLNLGFIYFLLGQYDKALQAFEQATPLAKATGLRPIELQIGYGLWLTYMQMGEYDRALSALHQIRPIFDSIKEGNPLLQGVTFNLPDLKNANPAQAVEQGLSSLQHLLKTSRALGNRLSEGVALSNLGSVYHLLDQPTQALDSFQQALVISQEQENRAMEAFLLREIGSILQEQKQPELAIVFLKQSVNITESIRQELRVLPQTQQESYTETVAKAYRDLADLLLQQDRVLEAQQVLDLLKVQELDDYFGNIRGGGQQIEFLRPEQEILKKYNELQKTAIQIGSEITELAKLDSKNALTPSQQQQLAKLKQLERAINVQFTAFVTSEEIQRLAEKLARSTGNQNVRLEELRRLKDKLESLDAVLLYPLILNDRLELVLITPGAPPLRRTVKNLSRAELNQTIVEFRTALGNRQNDVQTPAQKLYSWLIAPIEADLKQAKPKTILYAPDGQLRYIPLAALYDGQQWLVQRYRIQNITALVVSDLTTPPHKEKHVLAAAFGDREVTISLENQAFKFYGLPFARKEVQSLTSNVAGTVPLFDQAFSRDAMLTRMNSFNIVHLATHGKFLIGNPQQSFIVMGNGERLSLNEIQDNSLDNIDLVVLSACETGVGLTGKDEDGVEVLGIGYQFQRGGAKAAIASLWPIHDGGTQRLMDIFYGLLKQGNISKVEALQQAQVALISGDFTVGGKLRSNFQITSTSGPSTIPTNLKHPFYWAPFILIGNGL